MRVDVPALLDRLDVADSIPDVHPRSGRWLVDRWWRLNVMVMRDHMTVAYDVWAPGIHIDCCDPLGRFGTNRFVAFDNCLLTCEQIDRVFAFIDRWEERRRVSIAPRRTGSPRSRPR